MARREAHLHVTPQRVFDVLRDPGCYRHWVIGTTEIRAVEGEWPQAGSSLHYTVGWWPLRMQDRTTVREYDEDRRLRMEAHARHWGTAEVAIEVFAEGDGCRVVLDEHPVSGIGARLHSPLSEAVLRVRNVRMMRHLKELAERGRTA